MHKPDFCKESCPLCLHSTGFVRDYALGMVSLVHRPLFAVVLKMPGRDEIVNGVPMSGRAGRYWQHEFLEAQGIEREDVIICNVIRCFPERGVFPVGKLKTQAVAACRYWDDKLKAFDPNLFGVTFNPAALLRVPQTTKMLKRSILRAKEYAVQGYRPCLLMGEEARDTFAPWLTGTMKKWQGHWWKGSL